MTTSMVITQPQPMMVSQDSDEWGSGTFDCLEDLPRCCFAYWCCPCFACVTSREYGEPLCLPLLDIFGGYVPPITMAIRVSMRHRYGIRGTLCMDCLCSSFCTVCTWCQMSREIKRRKIPIVMVSAKNT